MSGHLVIDDSFPASAISKFSGRTAHKKRGEGLRNKERRRRGNGGGLQRGERFHPSFLEAKTTPNGSLRIMEDVEGSVHLLQ